MQNLKQMIEKIVEKYDNINNILMRENLNHTEIIKLSKDKSAIEDICILGKKYLDLDNNLIASEIIIADKNNDKDLISLANDEIYSIKEQLPLIENDLRILLLPQDPMDDKNAIIEIRAGTGGDEAALFATDLVKMYQRYSEKHNWKCEIVNLDTNGLGGVKDVSIEIFGNGVYGKMRFESGTHRVQRVPVTEKNGRIHTSAVTVAVFPELDDIDITIDPKDLKIDVFCSSGAGGQHVNKTESAIRITHLPTNIIVVQQTERSQIKNKEKAMKILRSRIYESIEEKRRLDIAKNRKEQVGSGDRSEKIRTYNFPQNRLTDHRVNYTNYNMEQLLNEGLIDELITILRNDYQVKLQEENDNFK